MKNYAEQKKNIKREKGFFKKKKKKKNKNKGHYLNEFKKNKNRFLRSCTKVMRYL